MANANNRQANEYTMTHQGIESWEANGYLHARLTNEDLKSEGVDWRLHRGDYDPRRTSEPTRSGATWKVKLPDRTNGYSVSGEIAGKRHVGKWHQHYSRKDKFEYEEWRKRLPPLVENDLAPIPLFRYEHPFDNIAFVHHVSDLDQTNLDQFAKVHGFRVERCHEENWQNLTVLSQQEPGEDPDGVRYVFSGITRNAEQLLLGAGDLHDAGQRISGIRNQIGEFHMLSWNDRAITFEHDYIGQGHLYYYQKDDIFVGANGLHLLCLVLNALGIKLTVNERHAKGKFFSTTYPFEIDFGPQTDFNNIYRVSVYDRIQIDKSGSHLSRTELWHDNKDGHLDDDLYETLLYEATQDIIDNIGIALKHPKFDNVVCELSAGIDSRIVYSALTNLPISEKVRIHTRPGREESIAAQINNLYGYRWNDLGQDVSREVDARGERPLTSHSVFMDGYFIESMHKVRRNYRKPTLILTGHGGEAFSRAMSVDGFFARSFRGEFPDDIKSMTDLEEQLIRWVGNHQVWFDAGDKYFLERLEASLSESPSQSLNKRFIDLYVSQRNPFIGGSVYRGAMSAPQWRPLQSKTLFRLRSLWLQRKSDFRLQFDLVRSLNPLISEVPYEDPVNTLRKKEFSSYRPDFGLLAPIEFDSQRESLAVARNVADEESRILPDKATFEALTKSVSAYEESADSFLEPLSVILRIAPEFEEMGLPLYTYVKRVINRNKKTAFSKRHNVRNKLHILMQELLMTAGDSGNGRITVSE